MENLISTILGTYCVLCEKPGTMICYSCQELLSKFDIPCCCICGRPSFAGKTHVLCLKEFVPKSIFSSYKCDEDVNKIINISKKPPNEFGAFEKLVSYGIRYAILTGYYISDFSIVCMPYSKSFINSIGYNPSLMVAKEINKQFGLRIITENIPSKKVLLVNDVFEKDDYMLEYAKHLYEKGVSEVQCFTIARML